MSKKLRFTVFARDGYQCQYCGRTPPAVVLEPDHVVPVCDGGKDTEENLVTACFDCNRGKGRDPAVRPLRPAVKARTEQIKESEEQLAAYRELLRAQQARREGDVEAICQHFTAVNALCNRGDEWVITERGKQSVRQWLRDWTVEDLKDALSISIPRFAPDHHALFAYTGGILRKWRTEGRQ